MDGLYSYGESAALDTGLSDYSALAWEVPDVHCTSLRGYRPSSAGLASRRSYAPSWAHEDWKFGSTRDVHHVGDPIYRDAGASAYRMAAGTQLHEQPGSAAGWFTSRNSCSHCDGPSLYEPPLSPSAFSRLDATWDSGLSPGMHHRPASVSGSSSVSGWAIPTRPLSSTGSRSRYSRPASAIGSITAGDGFGEAPASDTASVSNSSSGMSSLSSGMSYRGVTPSMPGYSPLAPYSALEGHLSARVRPPSKAKGRSSPRKTSRHRMRG